MTISKGGEAWMFSLVNVNWVEVVAAVVASMVIGYAWYSNLLFGKEWQALVGKSEADLKANASTAYGGTIVLGLITATIMSLIIEKTGAATYSDGAMVGAVVWLGFVATSAGVTTFFEGSRKKLWLINTGYQLVNYLVMGAIIAGWA
ncbi:MAG TPA: DUF1761 domain-containing protein [Candidatus Nanoarchaeia archaeon]